MIQVSNGAIAVCSATVQQLSGAQTNSKCLRLLKQDKSISISFEVPRSEDKIVHHKGLTVLAVPADVADDLAGRTLDLAPDGNFVIA